MIINNNFLMILILIILLLLIIILLFKIIYCNIETFESTFSLPSSIYKLMMSNYQDITIKSIDSTQSFYNYYSNYEVVETNENDKYYFNIYYSYNVTYNKSFNKYISSLFTINDKNVNNIFKFNRPTNFITIGSGSNILNNYIIIDFINKNGGDTKFKINKIDIAIYNNSVSIDNINFYSSLNTSTIINPSKINLVNIKYLEKNINNVNTYTNIYTYTFTNSNNEGPVLDDLIISFNTPNDVSLFYINIYGLPENDFILMKCIEYKNTPSTRNIASSGDVTTASLNDDDLTDYNNCISNAKNIANDILFSSESLSDIFRKIIANNIPWGIYNGTQITIDTDIKKNSIKYLRDLLNRNCKNAIINDPNNELIFNSNEECLYMGYDEKGSLLNTPIKTNISHLKGTTNISINFPSGSLPKNYTICAITRYTSDSSRNRIITSKNFNPINFILGHWSNKINCMHNNKWITDTNISGNNNWIVSCAKSSGNKNDKDNSKFNSAIFNGKSYGNFNNSGNGYNSQELLDTNNILTVNGYELEKSNFGLSYLIIWDRILTDSELDIVSKNLINTILDSSYQLAISDFTVKNVYDGLSQETSVDNPSYIKNNNCVNTDNYYWINIPNNTKQKIFCILNDNIGNYGSGWMLAMKGLKNSKTFKFNSNYWTTKNTLNALSYPSNIFTDDTTEIKTDIFNYYIFKEILIIYNDPSLLNIDNNNYYLRSYYKLQKNYGVSLADFFANNYVDIIYANNGNKDLTNTDFIKFNNNSVVEKVSMQQFNRIITSVQGINFKNKFFSQQIGFKNYGLNLMFKVAFWNTNPQYARIGAAFNNENNEMLSSDNSCGIGLNYDFASGNNSSRWQSSGPNKSESYPFLLFVR